MSNNARADYLISNLKSKDYRTYQSAKTSLSQMGNECISPLIDALSSGPWNGQQLLRATEVFKNLGSSAVPMLLKEINHPSVNVRNTVIEAIGEIGASEALEPLLALLNHESSSTRSKVINALRCIGDEKAVGPVIESINDDPGVIASAAAFLNKMNQEKYIDLVVSLLEKNLSHPDWKIRNGALWQLGQTKNNKAVQPIVQSWKHDKESVVREEAFLALRKILSDYEISKL